MEVGEEAGSFSRREGYLLDQGTGDKGCKQREVMKL
jgi:hypothetical protein